MESLLIAAPDNAIRTSHIKARIDKMQEDAECRLCGDRDEMINHIISECVILAQKEYKAKYDWVGKVIPWEMCKKFKFDPTNKWFMHKPAHVRENDTHKLLWRFNIQTDHQIRGRRPDFVEFAVPANHILNLKEWAKKDKYFDLARELKNCRTWKWRLYQLLLVLMAQ